MIKTYILLVLLTLPILADNIGYAAAETPDFGSKDYVQEDTLELFDEIVELAYEICGDAGVTIAVKLRLTQGVVNFKDTEIIFRGKRYRLKPHEVNAGAIDYFYDRYNREGRKFLREVTSDNDLDALFFAKFKKSALKKAIRKKKKNSNIVFISLLYLPQTGATTIGRVKINVEDLATEPMYDLDLMQAAITKSYLTMYEKALKLVQMSGGIQRDIPKTTDVNTKSNKISTSELKVKASKEKPLYDDANW
jgi:hypothetical protein